MTTARSVEVNKIISPKNICKK